MLGYKAKSAIKTFNVDLVVANLLQTRREIVYLYLPNSEDPIKIEKKEGLDLEEDIIQFIKDLHT